MGTMLETSILFSSIRYLDLPEASSILRIHSLATDVNDEQEYCLLIDCDFRQCYCATPGSADPFIRNVA